MNLRKGCPPSLVLDAPRRLRPRFAYLARSLSHDSTARLAPRRVLLALAAHPLGQLPPELARHQAPVGAGLQQQLHSAPVAVQDGHRERSVGEGRQK